MAAQLDDIDRQLLDTLKADGRISVRSLAERVHISRANAYARIERLQTSGVITGYAATVDPVAVGLSTSAYVTLRLQQADWRDIRAHLQKMPEVVHIALVGGEFDAIVLIRAADNAHLRRTVLGDLQSIPGVLSTRTLLVFEEVGEL